MCISVLERLNMCGGDLLSVWEVNFRSYKIFMSQCINITNIFILYFSFAIKLCTLVLLYFILYINKFFNIVHNVEENIF